MSKATFYRIPLRVTKAYVPLRRANTAGEAAVESCVHRRRPLSSRRIALARRREGR